MKINRIPVLKLAVPAAVVLLAAILNAEAGTEYNDSSHSKNRQTEAESYFQAPVLPVIASPEKIQVFNSEFRLVYESSDQQDRKLRELLVRSDLILEINNTHIYQLSR